MNSAELKVYIDRARANDRIPGGLIKQHNYRLGYEDQRDGKPCALTNGAYLDGYHGQEGSLKYITLERLERL